MKTLNEAWAAVNRRFERKLSSCYQQADVEPQARLFEAMNYSLLAGGKRLRPFLTYLFCVACGGSVADADPAALAIELIHTYSLIHDDLPAMDNDDYRRGRLTNHKVYGDALAILAGDGLLTDAFRILVEGLAPEKAAACVKVLSENAGPYGMVGGQVLDMESEERALTEQEVLDIQSRKTGCLIRAACEMGVLCADGSDEQRAAARSYADGIGLAFQIRDDMLDVTGDAAKLGKAVGVDANKNTFVRLYGLSKCAELVNKYTATAAAALAPMKKTELLYALAWLLAERDH